MKNVNYIVLMQVWGKGYSLHLSIKDMHKFSAKNRAKKDKKQVVYGPPKLVKVNRKTYDLLLKERGASGIRYRRAADNKFPPEVKVNEIVGLAIESQAIKPQKRLSTDNYCALVLVC